MKFLIAIPVLFLFSGICYPQISSLQEQRTESSSKVIIARKFIEYANSIYGKNTISFNEESITGVNENFTFYAFTTIGGAKGCLEIYGNRASGVLWFAMPELAYIKKKKYTITKWFSFEYIFGTEGKIFTYIPVKEIVSSPFPKLSSELEKQRNYIKIENSRRWFRTGYSTLSKVYNEIYKLCGSRYDLVHWSNIAEDEKSMTGLHNNFQDEILFGNAFNEFYESAPDEYTYFQERVTKGWGSAMLRGFVTKSGDSPEGDFSMNHTYDYCNDPEKRKDVELPLLVYPYKPMHGDKFERASDWCIHVIPDYDLGYLKTYANTDIEVEIERFDLRPFYRTVRGDYCQIYGRWVIDTGHEKKVAVKDGISENECNAEIHPPELIVTTKYNTPLSSESRVTTTGAWKGNKLKFFIWPPARPSENYFLKSSFSFNQTDVRDASIDIIPVPENNPNHYECIVNSSHKSLIQNINEEGFTYLHDTFFIRGVINTVWQERTDSTAKNAVSKMPVVEVTGRIENYENGMNNYVYSSSVSNDTIIRTVERIEEDGSFKFYTSRNSIVYMIPFVKAQSFENTIYTFESDKFINEDGKPFTSVVIVAEVDKGYGNVYPEDFSSVNNFFKHQDIDKMVKADAGYEDTVINNLNKNFTDIFVKSGVYDYKDSTSGAPTLNAGFIIYELLDKGGDPLQKLSGYYSINNNSDYEQTVFSNVEDNINFLLKTGADNYENFLSLDAMKGKGTPGCSALVSLYFGSAQTGYRIIDTLTAVTDSEGKIKLKVTSYLPGSYIFEYKIISNPVSKWLLPQHISQKARLEIKSTGYRGDQNILPFRVNVLK
ncbi:MAG: hypothetical protein SGI89_14780 [bacterium]|nr:hypothetical protein [bacterium]